MLIHNLEMQFLSGHLKTIVLFLSDLIGHMQCPYKDKCKNTSNVVTLVAAGAVNVSEDILLKYYNINLY